MSAKEGHLRSYPDPREIFERINNGLRDVKTGILGGQRSPKSAETPVFQSDPKPSRTISKKDIANSMEIWRKKPARIEEYPKHVYPDGTICEPGYMLIMGEPGAEEQVMDSFEREWANTTVETLAEGLNQEAIWFIGGWGEGFMARKAVELALSYGKEIHIAELNERVFGELEHEFAYSQREGAKYQNLRAWAQDKQRWLNEGGVPLKLLIYNEDANEVLRRMAKNPAYKGRVNRVILDLHQTLPELMGVENLQTLDIVDRLLTEDGMGSICAFHKYNREGDLDSNQKRLLREHGFAWRVTHASAVPPPNSEYFQYPNNGLPVVTFERRRSSGLYVSKRAA